MKVSKLIDEVTALGFLTEDSKIELKKTMLLSINRAVRTIALEVAAEISEKSFVHMVQENRFDVDEIINYTGMPIVLVAENIRTFCFLCDGNGRAVISSDAGVETIELSSDGEFLSYKGFVSGDTQIVFEGDYSYNIKNLSGYCFKRSDDKDDIHCYDDYICYDLEKLIKNGDETEFLAMYEKPQFLSDGKLLVDVLSYTNGSKLYIKSNDSLVVVIKYKRMPTTIDANTTDDFIIELPSKVLFLLPLLTAFYLLRDDEPAMADIYYNDYEIKKNNLLLSDSTAVARVVLGEGLYADTRFR